MRSKEATLRWISTSIRRFDLECQQEQNPGERQVKVMDLLSTIKLCCDMETGDIEAAQNREIS